MPCIDLDARRDVASRHAVVDARLALALAQEALHAVRAELEIERGGDAVARHEVVGERILAVRVQVDEAGRHHQARHVERLAALERLHRQLAIGPSRMPMSTHASRPLSGSSDAAVRAARRS